MVRIGERYIFLLCSLSLLISGCGKEEVEIQPSIDIIPSTLTRSSITEVIVKGEGTSFDSETTFDFGKGVTILDSVVVNEEGAFLELYIDFEAVLGNRNVTVTYGEESLTKTIKIQKETPAIRDTSGEVLLFHHETDINNEEGCHAIAVFARDFGGFEDPLLNIESIPETDGYLVQSGEGWDFSSTLHAGPYILLSSSSKDIYLMQNLEETGTYYYSSTLDCGDILAGQTYTVANLSSENFLNFMKEGLRVELPLTITTPDPETDITMIPGEEFPIEWEEGFGNQVVLIFLRTFDQGEEVENIVISVEDNGSYTIPAEITSLLSEGMELVISIMRYERLEEEIAEGSLILAGVSIQDLYGWTARASTIYPSHGNKGETLDVSVQCQVCDFVDGSVSGDFGDGIEINSVTVIDSHNVVFNITIQPSAESGRRTVSIDYSTGVLEFTDGFIVFDSDLPLYDDCPAVFGTPSLTSGYYHGDTTYATNDFDPTSSGCTGFDEIGNDLVYGVYLNDGQTIDIYLEYLDEVDASIYILPDCYDESSCIIGSDENTGRSEELSYTHSGAPLTHYIVVDSFSGAGEFILDFEKY